MKKISTLILLLIGSFFASCSSDGDFEAMGVFESDEILLSSEISGKIVHFAAKEGDTLKKGDLIAKIDTTQQELHIKKLREDIKALEASLQDSSTQLAPLLEQIALAKSEQARISKLYAQKAGTKQNLDNANTELAYLQRDYEAKLQTMNLHNDNVNAKIAASKIEIALLEDDIQKAHIYAPINATLLEKYAFEAELSNANKVLGKIADMNNIYLKAYFIDTSLNKLALQDRVRVFVDYGTGYKEYEGVITYIASNAEFTPKSIMSKDERKNLVYAVKISVKNDGLLRLGSYGEVRLVD